MIESVRIYLSQFGLVDEGIIDAMKKVDRRSFVSNAHRNEAYFDMALPVGENQTISQPSTVARMISLLRLKEEDSVLEIGTGSGWNAALISTIANKGEVLSLEISEVLAERAEKKIKEQGIRNVVVSLDDFRLVTKKFDKIIFTAGISEGQEEIIEQFAESHLNELGILVCPFESGPIIVMNKTRGKIEKYYTDEDYEFVPLVL